MKLTKEEWDKIDEIKTRHKSRRWIGSDASWKKFCQDHSFLLGCLDKLRHCPALPFEIQTCSGCKGTGWYRNIGCYKCKGAGQVIVWTETT